ncbi:trypsin-like peptidase domain-containing protein [Streptomyces somaliensis]|uniref:S1C family serine protease n=1 Tax=Streptomyces somaliensis TaxID=78355 RepID=UPI0020CF64F4|nr:trypsin-like peptidase domain-containing protein [Streptomyces somaliensis]MCP9945429.1 trypsin-like peptidase domain-containing protein [Streptomyces somaliensis]
MSTENEGTAVPSAPDAPSASAPQGAPEGPAAPTPPPGNPGRAPEGTPHGAREGDPATPAPDPAEPYGTAYPATPPPPAAPPAYPPYGAPAGTPAARAYAQGPAGHPGDGWGTDPAAPTAAPPRKRSGGLVATVLAAALLAGGIGGGIGYWAAERDGGAGTSTTVSVGDTRAGFEREPGTVAAVASKALPSVVTIEAKSGGSEGGGGTGTGFVYDKEGHILTNNHVVASAAEAGTVTATFSDGREFDAEVVGRAQGYDVAVLKLRNAPRGLTPLPLGDSDKVAVGDSTIAIGAPFGLSNTVTTGIISAKNRPVASSDGSGGKNSYMSALQTDASINPGNSGGPLLDGRGAVIGINSAIQSPGSGGLGQSQAGSVGLGFAIPVNQAKNVAEQLIRTGEPVYPMIGATVSMSEEGEGATIVGEGEGGTPSITPNGPAARAGLRPGDVITRFGNRVIDSGPTLISEIWTHRPGDTVALTYERDGREKQVRVTLGQRKGD